MRLWAFAACLAIACGGQVDAGPPATADAGPWLPVPCDTPADCTFTCKAPAAPCCTRDRCGCGEVTNGLAICVPILTRP